MILARLVVIRYQACYHACMEIATRMEVSQMQGKRSRAGGGEQGYMMTVGTCEHTFIYQFGACECSSNICSYSYYFSRVVEF